MTVAFEFWAIALPVTVVALCARGEQAFRNERSRSAAPTHTMSPTAVVAIARASSVRDRTPRVR
jgi:hypothetical protein